MHHLTHLGFIWLSSTLVFISLVSCKLTIPDEDCETCRLNKEIEELKSLLKNCEEEIKLYKDSIVNQKEVESSSALSYLGSFFYGISPHSKRSSPLHSTVNTFLQNLNIDEKQNLNDINYVHEADVRYENISSEYKSLKLK